MEIDFLGLNSKFADYDSLEQKNSEAREFVDPETGGDISLSLSTSSQLNCRYAELPDFREKRKFPSEKICTGNSCGLASNYDCEREQPRLSLIGRPILHSSGFLRNHHNHKLSFLRNTFELPNLPASATIFCRGSSHDISAQKVDHRMCMAGSPSSDDTKNSARGHVPTVAMARRATLARFLEKRSHRLTQTRKSHLMGRTFKVSGAYNMMSKYQMQQEKLQQYQVML